MSLVNAEIVNFVTLYFEINVKKINNLFRIILIPMNELIIIIYLTP